MLVGTLPIIRISIYVCVDSSQFRKPKIVVWTQILSNDVLFLYFRIFHFCKFSFAVYEHIRCVFLFLMRINWIFWYFLQTWWKFRNVHLMSNNLTIRKSKMFVSLLELFFTLINIIYTFLFLILLLLFILFDNSIILSSIDNLLTGLHSPKLLFAFYCCQIVRIINFYIVIHIWVLILCMCMNGVRVEDDSISICRHWYSTQLIDDLWRRSWWFFNQLITC